MSLFVVVVVVDDDDDDDDVRLSKWAEFLVQFQSVIVTFTSDVRYTSCICRLSMLSTHIVLAVHTIRIRYSRPLASADNSRHSAEFVI